jgi:IS5 family transposase
VGVDAGSGLIRSVITTPANVNDTTPADELIRRDEKQVLADAAYHTHAPRGGAEGRGGSSPGSCAGPTSTIPGCRPGWPATIA